MILLVDISFVGPGMIFYLQHDTLAFCGGDRPVCRVLLSRTSKSPFISFFHD